jgi:uncharacterized protein involved in exopolysaccharide biosynthesis
MITRETRSELQHESAEGEEGEEGFDSQAAKDLLGFAWHAPRRRPLLAACIFLVVSGLGLTIAATMPRIYNVTVKLFAQRTAVLPEAGTGRGAREEDYPMKNVADVIRQHDNMVDVVEHTNLVDRFYELRSPALRLKDQVLASIGTPPTDEDKETGVLATLDKKLVITTDEDSVTISVDWFDPKSTFDVAAEIEHNLLDAKYDSQAAMIQDAVNLLEQHAKAMLTQVDDALADYEAQRAKLAPDPLATAPAPDADPTAPSAAAPVRAPVARRQAAAGPSPDADVARELEEKRQRIRMLEGERQRQADALKEQLRVALLTLTPRHPTVLALQRAVEEQSEPPPELAQLKSDERKLMAEIIPPSATPLPALGLSSPAASATGAPTAPLAVRPTVLSDRDNPALTPARQRLESAIAHYQDATSRIDSAKLELEFARRACRYRYRVITPPEVPRSTKKPMRAIVGIGCIFAGFLLALLGSTWADLSGGVLLETWQVRRQLKLDVLSEIDSPVGRI